MNRWLVAAASVVMMSGLGSFNAWSVFRRPLSELYGANVTDVNTAFFVSSLVFGLMASGSALLVGWVGPRLVGVTGALLYGLGVLLCSFAGGSLPFLYLTYGLVAAIGLGLAVMAPIAALPSWFPERPGFAYGIAFIGFGMGPLVNERPPYGGAALGDGRATQDLLRPWDHLRCHSRWGRLVREVRGRRSRSRGKLARIE